VYGAVGLQAGKFLGMVLAMNGGIFTMNSEIVGLMAMSGLITGIISREIFRKSNWKEGKNKRKNAWEDILVKELAGNTARWYPTLRSKLLFLQGSSLRWNWGHEKVLVSRWINATISELCDLGNVEGADAILRAWVKETKVEREVAWRVLEGWRALGERERMMEAYEMLVRKAGLATDARVYGLVMG